MSICILLAVPCLGDNMNYDKVKSTGINTNLDKTIEQNKVYCNRNAMKIFICGR